MSKNWCDGAKDDMFRPSWEFGIITV